MVHRKEIQLFEVLVAWDPDALYQEFSRRYWDYSPACKCLLCKHEELRLIYSTHIKKKSRLVVST